MSAIKTNKDRGFTKAEKSWILYDWANSVYATNIMAAIFPTIFVSIAGTSGDMWWGYGTSIATFIIALLAPIMGAAADYKGMKKKLFTQSGKKLDIIRLGEQRIRYKYYGGDIPHDFCFNCRYFRGYVVGLWH